MVPTTLLKDPSAWPARAGSISLTLASTAESRTWGVIGPIREPETATPSAQATSSTATAESAAPPIGVEGAHRLPGDLVTHLRAGVLERGLADGGREDDDEERAERDPQGRGGVAECLRGEPDAEEAAEQQADGGEGAGDEALPVAREGVGEHHEDEQPVEEVHRPGPSWKLVFGAGIAGGSSPLLP